MITTRALTKRYGELRAVDAIDLEVAEGDVYGFLGANGSGKTTTLRMLLGLVLPTSGEIEVLGEAIPAGRSRVLPWIGSLVEGPGAYPHLSGRANLALLDASGRDRSPRRVRGLRIAEVLGRSGSIRTIADRSDVLPRMRQRLGSPRPSCVAHAADPRRTDKRPGPQGIQEIRDYCWT